MTPIDFDEGTHALGAGGNPNTKAMQVVTAIDPDTPGVGFVVSCWEPTVEELAEIIKNKKIYISVMCNLQRPTQPPIAAMAFNPFTHYDFKALQYRQSFSDRMFLGKINVELMAFKIDDVDYSITVDSGRDTFILKNVIKFNEHREPTVYGSDTKEYFKAWEILSANYKEV